MAVEAPTNCWTRSQDKIITALSKAERFREAIVSDTESDALNRIFGEQLKKPASGHVYTKKELQNLKGYGQVYSADESPYGFTNDGSGRLKPFGNSIMVIRRLVTDYERSSRQVPLETERWFQNRVGDAMEQVTAYLEEFSGPFISGMSIPDAPWLNDEKEWDSLGMWQTTEIAVAWGYQR